MNIKDILAHYATVSKESSEYKQHEEFNERLDTGDIEGFQLILRGPDGTEQSISQISGALFVSDLPIYRQLIKDDIQIRRNSILELDKFTANDGAYDKLLRMVRQKANVLPFVGAGFSVASGCPSWSDYILNQAVRVGLNRDEVKRRLKEGEQEILMDEVVNRLSLTVFQRDFTAQFESAKISPTLSPSVELIDLFDGCYITTNFDRILEKCHAEKRGFEEKVVGKERTGRFLKAIYRSEKYLLKLHGNIDEQRNRVLTQAEYNEAYGSSNIDYSLPIPNTIKRIFSSYSVLFVGCSLISDRYLQILRTVRNSDPDFMPEHFAIINAPEDSEEFLLRDQFLADHGITPIWYTDGEWGAPGEILKLLKAER